MKKILKLIYLKLKYRDKSLLLGKKIALGFSSDFEGYNKIGDYSSFSGKMGFASYIGSKCDINADIGRYSCIANYVVTAYGKHPTQDWVSMHPAFYSTAKQCGFTFVNEEKYDENQERIKIGNDVWIASGANIIGGINIGDGCVVGAGAVVTKDIPPYSIVVGVPARVVKKRFDDETIDLLEKIQWWDWPDELIKERYAFLSNVPSKDALREMVGI